MHKKLYLETLEQALIDAPQDKHISQVSALGTPLYGPVRSRSEN